MSVRRLLRTSPAAQRRPQQLPPESDHFDTELTASVNFNEVMHKNSSEVSSSVKPDAPASSTTTSSPSSSSTSTRARRAAASTSSTTLASTPNRPGTTSVATPSGDEQGASAEWYAKMRKRAHEVWDQERIDAYREASEAPYLHFLDSVPWRQQQCGPFPPLPETDWTAELRPLWLEKVRTAWSVLDQIQFGEEDVDWWIRDPDNLKRKVQVHLKPAKMGKGMHGVFPPGTVSPLPENQRIADMERRRYYDEAERFRLTVQAQQRRREDLRALAEGLHNEVDAIEDVGTSGDSRGSSKKDQHGEEGMKSEELPREHRDRTVRNQSRQWSEEDARQRITSTASPGVGNDAGNPNYHLTGEENKSGSNKVDAAQHLEQSDKEMVDSARELQKREIRQTEERFFDRLFSSSIFRDAGGHSEDERRKLVSSTSREDGDGASSAPEPRIVGVRKVVNRGNGGRSLLDWTLRRGLLLDRKSIRQSSNLPSRPLEDCVLGHEKNESHQHTSPKPDLVLSFLGTNFGADRVLLRLAQDGKTPSQVWNQSTPSFLDVWDEAAEGCESARRTEARAADDANSSKLRMQIEAERATPLLKLAKEGPSPPRASESPTKSEEVLQERSRQNCVKNLKDEVAREVSGLYPLLVSELTRAFLYDSKAAVALFAWELQQAQQMVATLMIAEREAKLGPFLVESPPVPTLQDLKIWKVDLTGFVLTQQRNYIQRAGTASWMQRMAKQRVFPDPEQEGSLEADRDTEGSSHGQDKMMEVASYFSLPVYLEPRQAFEEAAAVLGLIPRPNQSQNIFIGTRSMEVVGAHGGLQVVPDFSPEDDEDEELKEETGGAGSSESNLVSGISKWKRSEQELRKNPKTSLVDQLFFSKKMSRRIFDKTHYKQALRDQQDLRDEESDWVDDSETRTSAAPDTTTRSYRTTSDYKKAIEAAEKSQLLAFAIEVSFYADTWWCDPTERQMLHTHTFAVVKKPRNKKIKPEQERTSAAAAGDEDSKNEDGLDLGGTGDEAGWSGPPGMMMNTTSTTTSLVPESPEAAEFLIFHAADFDMMRTSFGEEGGKASFRASRDDEQNPDQGQDQLQHHDEHCVNHATASGARLGSSSSSTHHEGEKRERNEGIPRYFLQQELFRVKQKPQFRLVSKAVLEQLLDPEMLIYIDEDLDEFEYNLTTGEMKFEGAKRAPLRAQEEKSPLLEMQPSLGMLRDFETEQLCMYKLNSLSLQNLPLKPHQGTGISEDVAPAPSIQQQQIFGGTSNLEAANPLDVCAEAQGDLNRWKELWNDFVFHGLLPESTLAKPGFGIPVLRSIYQLDGTNPRPDLFEDSL
ncbi:unnamed protein product [Amoebophrya sp. A120]|nr:unnamed protein product [Amoebophrya sp. A120]|eukprot:GSA120T00004400001.1